MARMTRERLEELDPKNNPLSGLALFSDAPELVAEIRSAWDEAAEIREVYLKLDVAVKALEGIANPTELDAYEQAEDARWAAREALTQIKGEPL